MTSHQPATRCSVHWTPSNLKLGTIQKATELPPFWHVQGPEDGAAGYFPLLELAVNAVGAVLGPNARVTYWLVLQCWHPQSVAVWKLPRVKQQRLLRQAGMMLGTVSWLSTGELGVVDLEQMQELTLEKTDHPCGQETIFEQRQFT